MSEIARVRYTHDGIIDEILLNPAISQGELARRFGYTESWMSIIVNSDAFKYRLADRKGELIDPKIQASVDERQDGLARRALDKLLDRIDKNMPFSNSELIAAAKLGIGEKGRAPTHQENNVYVVQMPSPAKSAEEWVSGRSRPRDVVDISHINPGV